MKKILLIIAIMFCVFQMVVLATEIDIGSPAIDGVNVIDPNFTIIDKTNPANETGKITSIEIWANIEMSGVEVATFYVVSGNNLSTRDYETVDNGNGAGVVLAGSKQTFTVDLNVTSGDYVGIHWTGGKLVKYFDGAVGVWYASASDYIPCTNETFSYLSGTRISLYGTGATAEAGMTWNSATITKFNTATITKWNGQ